MVCFWYRKSLGNKYIAISSQLRIPPGLLTPEYENLTFNLMLALRSVGIEKLITFPGLEGGGGGGRGLRGPPRENFENQESRRGHLWSFCRGNFTFSK